MPNIDISRVLDNPKLKTEFTVYRQKGKWKSGRFAPDGDEQQIVFTGVSQPGGTKDIIQVAEADRTSDIRVFLSKQQMYITHADDGAGNAGFSDEIEFEGVRYKIVKVKSWAAYGYYRAIGVGP